MKIAKLESLICPKVGRGGTNPLVPPHEKQTSRIQSLIQVHWKGSGGPPPGKKNQKLVQNLAILGISRHLNDLRSAFRNLHVDPLSLHTSTKNKQFAHYDTRGPSVASYLQETSRIQSLYLYLLLYQNCTVLATKYPFFNTKHPVIILRASLFFVTPSYVAP